MSGIPLETLTAMCLKLTIVLGSAFLAHTILRRASAATRHAIWVAAMLGLVLLPVLQLVMPAVEVATPAPLGNSPAVNAKPVAAVQVSAVEVNSFPWALLLAGLWSVGAAFVLARTAAGLWTVRQMLRGARPVSSSLFETLRIRMGVSPKVMLVESESAKTPMTLGSSAAGRDSSRGSPELDARPVGGGAVA